MGESRFQIREMKPDDVDNGLLETLDALRPASGMDRGRARRICENICADKDHMVVVAVSDGRVVGTNTLLMERKLIHNGGLVGHLEDLAVLPEFQGMGIGTALEKYAIRMAKERGCYRATMVCEERLIGFYRRCGFERGGISMRIYHK